MLKDLGDIFTPLTTSVEHLHPALNLFVMCHRSL